MAVEGDPDHVKKLKEQAQKSLGTQTRPDGATMTKVTVYKNGFKVNDGEFRDLETPENKKFMKDLTEGHVPAEVIRMSVYVCLLFLFNALYTAYSSLIVLSMELRI